MSVDSAALRAAIDRASARFRSHGGAVRIQAVGPDGDVRVAFDGLCAACPCRPVCLEHTLRPQLVAVPGVRSVDAAGARVSDEAAARLSRFLAGRPPAGLG